MIEELARHGYQISPGTLYPLLHGLERKGYLSSRTERAGRSQRRIYRTTEYGIEAMNFARERVRELVQEVAPERKARKRTRRSVLLSSRNKNGSDQ